MRLLLLAALALSLACTPRKDDSGEKMLLNYFLMCPGGDRNSCVDTCSLNECGVASTDSITPSSLDCVNSCISTCSANCDLTGLMLLYMEE